MTNVLVITMAPFAIRALVKAQEHFYAMMALLELVNAFAK